MDRANTGYRFGAIFGVFEQPDDDESGTRAKQIKPYSGRWRAQVDRFGLAAGQEYTGFAAVFILVSHRSRFTLGDTVRVLHSIRK
jgi:hypothetical protein